MKSAGICLFNVGYETPIVDVAKAIEERGFDSMFVPENTHMPVTRRQDLEFDIERLRQLAGFYDPFVALGAAAAVTKRIHLGTSVVLLTHRNVVATARAAASLDQLCDGRLIMGVAGGLIAEAMENHGSPFKQRWRIVRERVAEMRAIWQHESDSPSATNGNEKHIAALPKPAQTGGPPIWIGSNSAAVPGRVAAYADGWIVFNGRYKGDAIADLQRECEAIERPIEDITVSLMDAPEDYDEIQHFRQRGFERYIFIQTVGDYDEFRSNLDRLAALTARLRD